MKAHEYVHYEDQDESRISNVLIAPHGEQLDVLARFPARVEADADCAKAGGPGAARPASAQAADVAIPAASSPGPAPADGTAVPVGTDLPPCSSASFSYRTGAMPDDGFVDIFVTGKGVLKGKAVDGQTWKLIFDPKSFSYGIPDALQG